MKRKATPKDLISTAEVASILGVIPRRVQFLVTQSRLVPVMRVGRAMLFRRSDVTAFKRLAPGRPEKEAK